MHKDNFAQRLRDIFPQRHFCTRKRLISKNKKSYRPRIRDNSLVKKKYE